MCPLVVDLLDAGTQLPKQSNMGVFLPMTKKFGESTGEPWCWRAPPVFYFLYGLPS